MYCGRREILTGREFETPQPLLIPRQNLQVHSVSNCAELSSLSQFLRRLMTWTLGDHPVLSSHVKHIFTHFMTPFNPINNPSFLIQYIVGSFVGNSDKHSHSLSKHLRLVRVIFKSILKNFLMGCALFPCKRFCYFVETESTEVRITQK